MTSDIITRVKLAARILLKGTSPSKDHRKDIPVITPEEVAQIKQFFPLDKFFIFGHARSGTTLLARLIRVHPEVHCNWQAHFFTRPPLLESLVADPETGAWLARRSNRWNEGRDLSPLVLRAAGDFILERQARTLKKRIVGDKSPNSLLDGKAVTHMHAIYPDTRLIYIVRDGRDAVLSHRFQTFIDATQHLSKEDWDIRAAFVRHPEPFLQGERSIFTEKGIRCAAEGWVRNVSETSEAGKEIYKDHYISLRFEDLLEDHWKEIGRLWKFLEANMELPGLEEAIATELQQNPDADWQQQKAGEIALSLQKGKKDSWREMFTTRDREIFLDIATGALQAWGYSAE